MQGFAGLSLFCVLLLMALGLAIIFGQMGVINMAHGEFMTIGAYTTYGLSTLVRTVGALACTTLLPDRDRRCLLSLPLRSAGLSEFLLIRHLYTRPLDTLLATWGLSLIMQQIFRSAFGAKEVSATLPDWLMGSVKPTEVIDIPINGLFVMGLTLVVTAASSWLFRSRWGLRVRATVAEPRDGQRSRHQHPARRPPDLRARLRHCRHRRRSLHHHRLDRADQRLALHRRHVPGGGVRRCGEPARHHRLGLRHRAGAVDHASSS